MVARYLNTAEETIALKSEYYAKWLQEQKT